MKISWKWLKEYVDLPCDAEEAAKRFTMAGLKVEGVREEKLNAEKVVTARILDVKEHPSKSHLKVGTLTQGERGFTVVSGAPSFQKGKVVALALPGARLPSGEVIEPKKFEGVLSEGMVLCSNELLTGQGPRPLEDILVFPQDQGLGQEVKEALDLDDWVIDLELTVNFSHCLSVIGVAVEASAIFGTPLRLPPPLDKWSFLCSLGSQKPEGEKTSDGNKPTFSLSLPDPDLCPRYVGKLVTDIQCGYSPVYVERRLFLSGMRPLNSIVDATNYVMLETGQPLHAFDARKISGPVISARRSRSGEHMISLDGQDRSLVPGTLVIADQEGPIAIAGVMGGLRTEVTPETHEILIESAYFDPLSVRLTSQRLNLRTEAAIRFEKGIDPTCQAAVAQRASCFIEGIGAGKAAPGWAEVNLLEANRKPILFRMETAKRYLWVDVGKDKCKKIFTSLRFDVEETSDSNGLSVTVPPRRVDIEEEVDLVEEIGRYYGYHAFPSKDMNRAVPGGPPSEEYRRVEKLRDFLASLGGLEVVTNSLLAPKDLLDLGWEAHDRRGQPVPLKNPLSSSESVLRTSLMPGLLKVVSTNLRFKTPGALFFEIGNVFLPSEKDVLPLEERMLGMISYGTIVAKSFLEDEKVSSFYYLKGILQKTLDLMGIMDVMFVPGTSMPFHPGKSARILIKGSAVGEIGDLHPICEKNLDLSSTPTLLWLALTPLINLSQESRFGGISRFMTSERDLAVIVDKDVPAGEVLALAEKVSDKVTSVELFDVYEKDPVPEGMKSLAMRLTFQPWQRPFTEEELSSERDKILAKIKERFGARER